MTHISQPHRNYAFRAQPHISSQVLYCFDISRCYVGGWLELNSIPEFGTDTCDRPSKTHKRGGTVCRYLYLNRAGNAQEELRTDLDASCLEHVSSFIGVQQIITLYEAALPIRGSLLNGAYYSSASSVSPNL